MIKILTWFVLLKVKKPIIDKKIKTKKWFDEIIKSAVIWGCAFLSP